MHEGRTIRQIRDAVQHGELEEPFSPRRVNAILGISWGGVFLPKHRVGNPDGNTELFVRVSSLASSALFGTRSGTPGQPMPQDVAIRDQASAVATQFAVGSPTYRFYDLLAKDAEASIKSGLLRDEELFE